MAMFTPRAPRPLIGLIALALAALVVAGCGPSLDQLDIDGVWYGITNDGEPLSFTVSGNSIIQWEITLCGTQQTSPAESSVLIRPNGTFDWSVSGSAGGLGFGPTGPSFIIKGDFRSSTRAVGTLIRWSSDGTCEQDTRWLATRPGE